MQFVKKHGLFFIFFLGLLLRLSLLFIDYSWDVNNHIAWAKDLHLRGPVGFFDIQSSEVYASLYPNYPPLSLFLFYLAYPLPKIIYQIAWFINVHVPPFPSNLVEYIDERFFLAGMMKLPGILADLGLAGLMVLFAKKMKAQTMAETVPLSSQPVLVKLRAVWDSLRSGHLPHIVAILILFNPVFFYNSAFWGQIDAIPLLFALLSFYLLLYSKRYLLSGLLFTLGLLVKPTILVFLPVYVAFFVQRNGVKNFIKTVFVCDVIFWLSFLPFLSRPITIWNPYQIYWHKILEAQSLPFVTNSAYNFWVLITGFSGVKDTVPFLIGIPYRIWGFATVSIITIVVLQKTRRLKDKTTAMITASFFISLAAFLFLTKMHERYYMLPLLFLLLLSVGEKRLVRWFYLLSALAFFNLYHSWPVPFIKPLFTLLESPYIYVSLSLLGVLVFIYLFRKLTQVSR